jgi:hypothetical protein
MADGSCDNVNNHMGCGFDGGDCCSYTTILSEDALPWCEEDEQTVTATSAGSCSDSCYGQTCDYWAENGYTCTIMETTYSCDCAGCSCGETPAPTPFETSAPSEAPKCTERVETNCYDAAKFGLEVGSSNSAWRVRMPPPSPLRATDIVRARRGIG